jgi:hypothetical protein
VEDEYFDDPLEAGPRPRKRLPAFIALGVALVLGASYLQFTLASNIRINSSGSVEFGQGITVTSACSGASVLTLTPYSTFTNASGSGAFYFTGFKLANIPSTCNGFNFAISAFDSTTSTPLALFNTSNASAVVYDNGSGFAAGSTSTGLTVVTNSSSSFTATFASPVALAATIAKVAIQSSNPAAFAQTGWTLTNGALNSAWDNTGMAQSSDGTKVVAVNNGDGIYRSTDSGVTWSRIYTLNTPWSGIASSSTGQYLVAVVHGGSIYASSDYGSNWSIVSGTSNTAWNSVVMASNGATILATADGNGFSGSNGSSVYGIIAKSTNYGSTFTTVVSNGKDYAAISASSDLSTAIVAAWTDGNYISTDSGASWTLVAGTGGHGNATTAISADGQYMMFAQDSSIYISTNSGVSFTASTVSRTGQIGAAINSNGSKIAVLYTSGLVALSTNYGSTWQLTGSSGQNFSEGYLFFGSTNTFYAQTGSALSRAVISGGP